MVLGACFRRSRRRTQFPRNPNHHRKGYYFFDDWMKLLSCFRRGGTNNQWRSQEFGQAGVFQKHKLKKKQVHMRPAAKNRAEKIYPSISQRSNCGYDDDHRLEFGDYNMDDEDDIIMMNVNNDQIPVIENLNGRTSKRVSFKLPEEADIFFYIPSDDEDDEDDDDLMMGRYHYSPVTDKF